MEVDSKPTILYVDDEQYNLDAFVAAYRRYYTIHTATSAADGMKILRENRIELIITDQRMPGMTGVEFLESIMPNYAKSVRMILTGFSDIEVIIESVNQGLVLRYITKPWDESELKQIIDSGIKIYRQEQRNQSLLKKLNKIIEKQEKTINLFQKYVPKDVLEKIVNPQADVTTTEAKLVPITVLFVDINHFSSFAEKVDPKALLEYLNRYFAVMVDIVLKNNGHIYKILGDGLISIFKDPSASGNIQKNAINCAQEMVEALNQFNLRYAATMGFDTTIGIGISSGEAIVGHAVSKNYLSFSVIGAVVDVAFKLKESSCLTPNTIVMDEQTYLAVHDQIKIKELMPIDAFNKKIKTYQLIFNNG